MSRCAWGDPGRGEDVIPTTVSSSGTRGGSGGVPTDALPVVPVVLVVVGVDVIDAGCVLGASSSSLWVRGPVTRGSERHWSRTWDAGANREGEEEAIREPVWVCLVPPVRRRRRALVSPPLIMG